MNVVTLEDLLSVPEISNFQSCKYVLHFKENNIIKIKDKYYECRIFAFDVSESLDFKDYVERNELYKVEVSRRLDHVSYRNSLLSYSKNTPEEYILISLRDLNMESREISISYN